MEQPITLAKSRTPLSLGAALVRALLLSLLVFAIAIGGGGYIAYQSDNPTALIRPMAYGILLSVSFFFGFLTSRIRGRQGLLCGGLSGAVVLLILTVGLLASLGDEGFSPARVFLTDLLAAALAVLGGILGCVRREKKHRRPRRA